MWQKDCCSHLKVAGLIPDPCALQVGVLEQHSDGQLAPKAAARLVKGGGAGAGEGRHTCNVKSIEWHIYKQFI